MINFEDLNSIDKAVLVACGIALNGSLSAHVTKQCIMKKVSKNLNPKHKKKSFDKLLSKGLIRKHPTGRSTTYELTREGRDMYFKMQKDKS